MAEISEDDTFTQVVRFDVPPDKQMELIEAIAAEVERWVRHRPGFISSSFHASFDGGHVLNYAQWRSREDFEGFTRDPETIRLQQAVKDVSPSLKPHAIHCRVVRSISQAF
ncbi:antibiotic biosynthesis monooxygenase [Pseudomonas syringae pv. tomato]|uniref:Antibiotic biosynthesis monooxygenase n=1 Tax=Pseudomonas syringae pv. tomato TaxID=323 RepID=A0AB36KR98_PSEUB|nr:MULTISPECIES: antibiotic biosynthesis monooxygenase family protein [Pseudomonas]MBI6846211.1 antibiotic biosynthesis monooxygenase [Pseudomonas syringae]MBX6512116.1 antibiotic biosynthesis monooxygenase [Pseudomonas syringae pv. tomato]OPE58262.1 antibiotic biosynthesis monooxygenase [Pseudomonas syringae pv. tomato]TES56424.1 antibiotic biosynthesis monooxygenase [Pseudomonas syringae pv. tomato]TES76171.1 antibiotic biosynthesis monooxygenase [Pseudomonas syringae pv. tomato]